MAMRTSSVFQPTLPLRGATHEHGPGGQPQPASTHAPLAGSDVPRVELFRDLRVSTHAPLAGSDMPITSAAQPSPFCFNPRSPCGERRARRERRHLRGPVSTHAPLAGSDANVRLSTLSSSGFQPTLPLRGATKSRAANSMAIVFQPTLPLRGATMHPMPSGMPAPVFQPTLPLRGATDVVTLRPRAPAVSTHAPLAGSDVLVGAGRVDGRVSTHAPLAGSDLKGLGAIHHDLVSTHAPLAGSDGAGARARHRRVVSTHAPLAGSDARGWTSCTASAASFNPRSPCGERRGADSTVAA